MSFLLEQLQEIFKSERKRRKINQVQLSEKTGISQPSISNILAGKQQATVEQYEAMLEAMGWDLPSLLKRMESPEYMALHWAFMRIAKDSDPSFRGKMYKNLKHYIETMLDLAGK